jgi:hypothetical protein
MIIWGSKAQQRRIGTGTFFCPQCAAQAPYTQMRVARYFTLYFIPLFPTATLGQYVQCGRCGTQASEAVLRCTPEQILEATKPWICPQCRNHNQTSQARCLACGAPRVQPPPLPRGSLPPIPFAPAAAPPVIPRAAPAPKRLSPLSKALVISSSLLALFVVGFIGLRVYQLARFVRQPHAPTETSEFYAATSRIGPLGPEASGNSGDAVRLAENMAAGMAVARKLLFTESKEKSLLDRHDTFKVYCDLRRGQCVFLVHVPELRRFDEAAQEALGNLAWESAQEVLGASAVTNQAMRLAVGLRGTIMYERVILGRYSPGSAEASPAPPQVERGFDCQRRLVSWFAPVTTNSLPMAETEVQRTPTESKGKGKGVPEF